MIIAGFSMVACSGGGSRKTVGKQCPSDYKPFVVSAKDTPNNQKALSLEPNSNEIPPGVYSYEGSTLYYVDKSDLRVELTDIKQKDNSFKAATTCIRNAKNSLGPVSVEALRSLTLSKNGKYLVETNNLTLKIVDTKYKADSVKTEKKLESPSEAYKGSKEAYLLSTNNNTTNYEIRSKGTTPNGEYILVVRLSRKDGE